MARVALGDCSPRAPSDPDVQKSRIRLLGSWLRCEAVGAGWQHAWCAACSCRGLSRPPGGVLYDGGTTASFGDELFALPVRALWETR